MYVKYVWCETSFENMRLVKNSLYTKMFKIYNKITMIYVAFVMLFFSESIYMLRHL